MKYCLALALCLFGHFSFSQTNPADSIAYELYLSQISLAEAYYQMGEIADAQATLAATDPSRRGWEWQVLHAMSDRSQQTLTAHGASVSTVAFSPDGKVLASAGSDSTIILWSYPDLAVLIKIQGHTDGVSTLDFSPDGRWLASGSRDKTVKIWDLEDGQLVKTLTEGLSRGIYAVKYSPDGKRLGTTSWRFEKGKGVIGFAKLFDLETDATLQSFDLDTHPVSGFDFSKDGKKALIVSWGEIAWYYDLGSGQPDWIFDMTTDIEEYNAVTSGQISPDGRWAAITGRDYCTRILDVATGKVVYQIEKHEGHGKWIDAVRFSADGKYIATGAQDALLQIRNAATGKLLHTLRGHTDFINGIAWHPTAHVLATASKDGSVKIWDVENTGEVAFDACDNGPWYAPTSPDGKWVATACSDTVIGLWNLKTGERDIVLPGKSANCAAFSPDGKRLATAGHDYQVSVWDIDSQTKTHSLEGHSNSIYGLAWSGNWIASAGDTTLRIWNIKTGQPEQVLSFPGKSPYALVFTNDGKRLVAGMADGSVYVISTANWKELKQFQLGTSLNHLSVDVAGNQVATCGKNVYTCNLQTGEIKEMKGHKAAVWGVSLSADGRYALSDSYDQTVKFWNTKTGRCTLTLHGFEDELFKTGILESGKGIFVTETQGVVRVMRF